MTNFIAAVVTLVLIHQLWKGHRMTQALDDLKEAVSRSTSVTESAVTLIKGFAAKFDAAKEDPAQIEALAAQMNHNADALAAAVSENTTPEKQPSEPGSDVPATPANPGL